ncbi:hypothetical protein L484_014685 [Morus notabilis]|uniref:Uncharacterized protein n=1 Tax=Morus notabilis TaxID=981085 RepID=W9SBY6_9ROSA|nr:hypothetical protein L484_014685 [Morus notabilis]
MDGSPLQRDPNINLHDLVRDIIRRRCVEKRSRTSLQSPKIFSIAILPPIVPISIAITILNCCHG